MKQHLFRIALATVTMTAIAAGAVASPAAAVGSAPRTPPVPARQAVQEAPSELEKKWGVQVVSIRLSAAGQYLDFRYKVIDADKAAPILNRKNEPRLIDEASGETVYIGSLPKLGRLRQNTRKPKAGRTYFMLFKNPGFVKPGSRVDILVGGFRINNLVVEG